MDSIIAKQSECLANLLRKLGGLGKIFIPLVDRRFLRQGLTIRQLENKRSRLRRLEHLPGTFEDSIR